jgi:hypothetical protein
LNGEITGKGKKTWADGRSYEGQWENGEMHGRGSWKSGDGLETYDGEFVNNKREGNGTLCLRNGDRYTGQFHFHKFHGHGSYLRENVVFLESDFQNGLLSGKSQIQWHKVAWYSGVTVENKLSGWGHFRCLDGSYETVTQFINNLPVFAVSGYDLKIDRSSCVEENPDTKGKDKKKEKEKKKPAGKKGSSVVEVETLVSLSPGETIGALSISLLYSGLEEDSSSASSNLPNPTEIRRALSLSLREFTPQPVTDSSDDPEAGLGEIVPLWKRSSTLEECAVAWERFPPCTLRFVNGVNPLSGERMALEGAPEFSSSFDSESAVIATQLSSQTFSCAFVTLPATALPSQLSSISFVLDFKLTPPAELLASDSSPLRTQLINGTPFLSLALLSWGISGAGDDDRLFSLSLLVPSPSTSTSNSSVWSGCFWELTFNGSVLLSRWSDSDSFNTERWHSVGLTLLLSDGSDNGNGQSLEESCGSVGDGRGAGVARVSSNLFVDGAGRVKVDKGKEAPGEALSELSEFLSPSSSLSNENSGASGEQGVDERQKVWKIGGSGAMAFDGLIKTLAICTE